MHCHFHNPVSIHSGPGMRRQIDPQSATMPTTLRGRFNPPAISTVAAPIDTPYSKIFVSAPKRPTA